MNLPTALRGPYHFQLRMLLGLFYTAHLMAAPALSQTDPDIDKILAAWNRHLSTLGCVKYVVDGIEFFPKDSIDQGFPEEDFTAPRQMTIWFDFPHNRFRKELSWHQADLSERVIRAAYSIQTFDGSAGWSSKPRDRNPERYRGKYKYVSNLVKDASAQDALDLGDRALLLAEGVVRPWNPSERPVLLPLLIEDFRVHGWAEREDSRCLVLRPSTRSRQDVEELWVDVEKGFSIVSYVRLKGARERSRLNLWYRSSGAAWTLDRFQHLRSGVATVQMQVLSRELVTLPESSLFSMQPHTGDIVRDIVASERYLVDGNRKLDVRQVYLQDQRASGRSQQPLWWIGGTLAGLAACVLWFFFWRSGKQ